MISRRNIRVKVMQVLYTLDAHSGERVPGEAEKSLRQNLDQTESIFLYLLHLITQIASFAQSDALTRASRRLATESDMNISTRIAGNLMVTRLVQLPEFKEKSAHYLTSSLVDRNLVKKLYGELVASPEYLEYVRCPERSESGERQILTHLFNEIMMKSESFDQHMEDQFLHWPDDRDMMIQLVNNYLGRPLSFRFNELISSEKRAYAFDLLESALENRQLCLDLIRPRLQNWDPDRIAAIDMIIMRMGLCEFLYFPTIPTKVTINEYIDVAKTYSTPQSGHFVNGILDHVLKDLEAAGRIQKKDRP